MARPTGAKAHTANKNKAIRQEALRESLAAGGHIQHILEICKDLNDLTMEMDATDVQRKRAVIDTKLKLVSKYLPDLKSVEFKNADGEEFKTSSKVQIIFNPVSSDD